MTNKFTPGKWYSRYDPIEHSGEDFHWIIAGSGHSDDGFCISGLISKEDAALVCAAPELLEALEEAFTDGFYETATESYDCVPKGFVEKARAAIRKARGEE